MSLVNECLVFTFKVEERTADLSDLCFDKLGFKNRVTLDGKDSFASKFMRFAEMAIDSDYQYFIRSDADRLVFSGILELLKLVEQDESIDWVNGECFDYVMNRFRHGTPHVIKRSVLRHLVDNPGLMQDVQKPESVFCRSIDNKFKLVDIDIFTNLHEYEQYPSKVCNAFLNRIIRNHYPSLYDDNYLSNLPKAYLDAINLAFKTSIELKDKKSMTFLDFSFLDEGFSSIDDSNLQNMYKKYLRLYESIQGRRKV